MDNQKKQETPANSTGVCPKCGNILPENGKFCTRCGFAFPAAEQTMKICERCGRPLAADAQFCPGCGTAVPSPRICPRCKAALKPGQAFCTRCGMKYAPGVPPTGTSPTDGQPPRSAGKNKALILGLSIGGAALAVAVLLTVAIFWLRSHDRIETPKDYTPDVSSDSETLTADNDSDAGWDETPDDPSEIPSDVPSDGGMSSDADVSSDWVDSDPADDFYDDDYEPGDELEGEWIWAEFYSGAPWEALDPSGRGKRITWHACIMISKDEMDFTPGLGTEDSPWRWKMYIREADSHDEWMIAECQVDSSVPIGDQILYRLQPGTAYEGKFEIDNEYEIVIVISDKDGNATYKTHAFYFAWDQRFENAYNQWKNDPNAYNPFAE